VSINSAVTLFTYLLAVGFLAVFLVVIWKMATNKIDLSRLVSEGDGKASLSRFQLLVFTLVIAGLYVILCIENGQLLEVPNSALGLLGISGGSFLISKGIGGPTKKETNKKDDQKDKDDPKKDEKKG
jgi:hypothetical protein